MGMPVMMCHLAECLMDRTLDCRWDAVHDDPIFHLAALKEGAMRLSYVGEFRPMNFLSETVGLSLYASLFYFVSVSMFRYSLSLQLVVSG